MAARMLQVLKCEVLNIERRVLQILGCQNWQDGQHHWLELHPGKTATAQIEENLQVYKLLRWQENIEKHPPELALAAFEDNQQTKQSTLPVKSLLDSIFDGLLWAAVPKRRRSLERRMTRRMGWTKIMKFSTPKRNIVACLECGHWKEAHTICGNCYSKVKEETEIMKAAINEEDRLYNAPKSEVVYLYEEERDQRPTYAGKYIVEMNKKRPTWWHPNLLTKANR